MIPTSKSGQNIRKSIDNFSGINNDVEDVIRPQFAIHGKNTNIQSIGKNGYCAKTEVQDAHKSSVARIVKVEIMFHTR